MAKPAARIVFLQFGFAVAVAAVLGRAAQVQIVQRERWSEEAERQRTVRSVQAARRGALYDRNGVPLAITQEFYHVGVAPNELEDIRAGFVLLVRNLGVSAPALDREFQSRKRWIYLHGPFNATQVQPLRAVKGIHLTGDYQRFYPSRDLARPVIGGLDPDKSSGAAGLELSLDSILTGIPGEAVFLKDRAGRRYESPSRVVREPVAGNDVVLTLDAELQEIAERGLDDALTEMKAEGGDVVFLDPATGELLALASRQSEGGRAAAGIDLYRSLRAGLHRQALHRRRAPDPLPGEGYRRGLCGERALEHAGQLEGEDPSDSRQPHIKGESHPIGGHQGLEQHRDGEILLSPDAGGAVRGPARLRLRNAYLGGVPIGIARTAGPARPVAADVHPAQHGDGV